MSHVWDFSSLWQSRFNWFIYSVTHWITYPVHLIISCVGLLFSKWTEGRTPFCEAEISVMVCFVTVWNKKLNRIENKMSFSNKCSEVSLDINFDERWYGKKWWCNLIMRLPSLRCQLENSVTPSLRPDWNIHSKGRMFSYLVAICAFHSWCSFIVWSYCRLDFVVMLPFKNLLFSIVGHKGTTETMKNTLTSKLYTVHLCTQLNCS